MSKYKDEEELFEKMKQANQKEIGEIYQEMKLGFVKFILKYFQARKDKAEDVYPEAFSKFYFNIKDGNVKLPLKSKLTTYLYAIGKNTYLKHNHGTYQKKVELHDTFDLNSAEIGAIDFYEYEAQKRIVRLLFEKIGDKCRKLLNKIYIEEIATKQICIELEINSLGTLRKQKFDCLKKMRKLLQNNKEYNMYGKDS